MSDHLLVASGRAQKSRVGTEAFFERVLGSMSVGVHWTARKTFSVFCCLERGPESFAVWLTFFPVGNGFLPPSVGFRVSFLLFSWIPTGLSLFLFRAPL